VYDFVLQDYRVKNSKGDNFLGTM